MIFEKNKIFLGLVFLSVFLAVGDVAFGVFGNFRPVMAQATKQSQQADRQAIQALINRQLKAGNAEDLKGVMETIHPQSPEYASIEQIMAKVFAMCDVRLEVSKVEFLKITANESKVRITGSAKVRTNTQQCKSNKTVTIDTLQKSNGQWKFYSTEVQKIEFLN